MTDAGLVNMRTALYRLKWEVEEQLRASATEPENAEQFRAVHHSDLGKHELGIGTRLTEGELRYSYPNLAVVGWRPRVRVA